VKKICPSRVLEEKLLKPAQQGRLLLSDILPVSPDLHKGLAKSPTKCCPDSPPVLEGREVIIDWTANPPVKQSAILGAFSYHKQQRGQL